SSALALVLIVGAIAGGAPLASAVGFLGGVVFALPAITVILALRYPKAREVANRVLSWAVRMIRRLFRKPGIDPAALDELLERLATIPLRWVSYAEGFGVAGAHRLFDCACPGRALQGRRPPVASAGAAPPSLPGA